MRDPARRTAYDVLAAVSTREAYANLLLAAAAREAGLHGRDAALATELVNGTLRNRGSYDAIIELCADRELGRIDQPVLDTLRLGAHQLLGMRIKPHAAVATSVDLAVEVAGRRPAGFVNAVLRRIAPRDLESWIAIAAPDRADDLVGHLSVRYSHPRWIVTALADALGENAGTGLAETEAALAADSGRPAVHLAAVPGLADQAELIAEGAIAARWSPFGGYIDHGDPGAIDAVAQRRAGVQDEASQLAVLALTKAATGPGGLAAGQGASPGGQRWLDMCAGPGGKARLLAGLAAEHGAVLLAADVHAHRAALAALALDGLGTAAVIAADGRAPAWRPASFDRVLADVPCSGLGSLRRRPEVRWRRDPRDVAALAGLQRRLLAAAVDSARPGGVVGYVTCSPHVAETREVLADVIGRHRRAEVLDAPAILSEVQDLRCPAPYERFAQFWPHRHGTDAIFVALLRATG
jgi:16S rRNA (cytosine967-C5)-methyltransferase